MDDDAALHRNNLSLAAQLAGGEQQVKHRGS